jgi:26S proteasome regulatory subunit N1
LEEGPAAVEDEDLREQLREIISNSKLSEQFLALARDLDVLEPKVPEDVYKTHLTGTDVSNHNDLPTDNAVDVDL